MSDATIVRMLVIFVNESDLWRDAPLYEVIVHHLKELGVAGATAHAGLIGFGHHHFVHHKGLFGLAIDRPVTIIAVDTEAKIRAIIPDMRTLVREGLVLLLTAEQIHLDPATDTPGTSES